MTYVNTSLSSGRKNSYLNQLIAYRHLCFNLVGADLRSRFRRSRLGVIWAVIQPLCFSIMVAVVWATLFQQSFLDFGVYVFSGLIVWEYFANVLMQSQDSLTISEGYLKQGRIPLIVFQARSIFSNFIVFLAGLVGLFGMLAALGQLPEWGNHLWLILGFVPILILFLFPLGILFSILGTQYRDLRHAVMIAINGLFFLSPVMLVREFLEGDRLQLLRILNPMIPLLDLFRAPLLESTYWQQDQLIVMGAWIIGLWIVALLTAHRFGRKIVFAL